MSWQDEQPPWGKKKGPSSPEDLIAALLKKIKDSFDPGNQGGDPKDPNKGRPNMPKPEFNKGSLGLIGLVLVVVIVMALGRSSFYTLDEAKGERGIVLRLGKFYTLTEPGPHFKMPFIDEVIKVSVTNVWKEEFGFRSRSTAQKSIFAKQGFSSESLMLPVTRMSLMWSGLSNTASRIPISLPLMSAMSARPCAMSLRWSCAV